MNDPPASSYIGRQKKNAGPCSVLFKQVCAACSLLSCSVGRKILPVPVVSEMCSLSKEEGDGPLGISEAMWMHRRAGVTVITFASFCCCSNGICLTILLKKHVPSSCCFLFLLSLEAY